MKRLVATSLDSENLMDWVILQLTGPTDKTGYESSISCCVGIVAGFGFPSNVPEPVVLCVFNAIHPLRICPKFL